MPPVKDEVTTTEAPARRRYPWPVEFYRSAVGKKWVMGVTGILLIGYLVFHTLGNLKMYLGAEEIDTYGEALRDLGGHLVPHTSLLWLLRGGLMVAAILHIHAAAALTATNWKARSGRYHARDYAVASYASRSMRATGVIVVFFLLFHLADLTWGVSPAASDLYSRGAIYTNMIASFERIPVAILYVVANLSLAPHLFHGTWSLFQSLGWNHPRFNQWRRYAAYAVTGFVVIGNLSFPIAVQLGYFD